MNKYRRLFSNTILISIGTFGSKLLTFFMVRFYTGYLTPAEYSVADLITTTANLLLPVISLGIAEGVFRFALDRPKGRKSVFSTGFYAVTIGALVLLLLLIPLSGIELFGGYLPLIALFTITSCYHSLCSQFVRAEGKTMLYSGQGLLNTALVIGLNILLLAGFHAGITGYVLSVALADLICTVFLVLKEKLWRQLTAHPKKGLIRQMLKYSLPLIPTTIFWWITSVSDRYMISAMISTEANGIYTVANKIPTILTLASGIFMEAWQFSAISETAGGRREQSHFYSKIWGVFSAALFVTCSAVVAFARTEIRILADSTYYMAWQYVPLLCAAMVFCAFTTFMGSVYMAEKKSGLTFVTAMIGAIVNIALNFLLIPTKLGVFGAAAATLVSYLVVFLLRAKSARKLIPFQLYHVRLWLSTAILLTQVVFCSFGLPGWIPVQAAAILLLLLLNYKPFVEIFQKGRELIARRRSRT